MKTTLKFLLFTFLLLQFPNQSDGQILRRSLNKLGRKVVEKKVEKEVDKKIDEVADSIVRAMDNEEPMTAEEKKEAEDNRRKAGNLMGSMMGGINKVDLPATFDFDYRIKMEMEDEKGKITYMTTFLNDNSSVMGYELKNDDMKGANNQFMVMDFEKEYMATFSEDKGKKIAMSMPLPMNMITSMAAEKMEDQQDDKNYSIEKTGNTKTINGYSCTEYIITDDENIQNVWMTKDVEVNTGFFNLLSQMMKEKQKVENPMIGEGYPILIEMIEKKKNKKSYIRTQEIKEGAFPFQASEYSYAY